MSLIDTFVQCGLLLLECPAPCATKSTQLARAIATLELLESNMAMALVLLEKYQSNCVTCLGSASTCYYMMIASLIVANKFLNDQSYTLKTWNMVLGKCSPMDVLLPLLNQLESHFLAALNYAVNAKAKPSMWQRFKALDQSHIGRFEGIMSCDVQPVARPCTPVVQSFLATPPLLAMYGVAPPDLAPLQTPRYVTYPSYRPTPATPMSMDAGAVSFLPTPLISAWRPPCKRRRLGTMY